MITEANLTKRIDEAVGAICSAFLSSDPKAERSAIFGLWSALNVPFEPLRGSYESASDEELEAQADALIHESLESTQQPNSFSERVKYASAVLWAAETLHLETDTSGYPRRAADLKVNYLGEAGWFIPLKPKFRSDGGNTRRSFARRGLRSSRIFPSQLLTGQKLTVMLTSPSALNQNEVPPGKLMLAGGLLPAWKPEFADPPPKKGEFLLNGWSCPNITSHIRSIAHEAIQKDSRVLVLPELCVPPQALDALVDYYSCIPSSGTQPPLTIAGSWHTCCPDGGGAQNLSHILLPTGRQLAQYAKMYAYYDTKLGREHIMPGSEVLVIISPDAVYAVAICLDFCSAEASNPFTGLDVDIVLVPSCSDEKTMEKHVRQAETRNERTRCSTFIVQQSSEQDYGYVAQWPSPAPKPAYRIQEHLTLRGF